MDNAKEDMENVVEDTFTALMAFADKYKEPEKLIKFFKSINSKKDESEEDKNAVAFLTTHSSKGLEFPIVIVAGASEGIFPHRQADDLDEERRIMYVAVTRAEKELMISTINGTYGRYKMTTSRFLEEMGLVVPKLVVIQ